MTPSDRNQPACSTAAPTGRRAEGVSVGATVQCPCGAALPVRTHGQGRQRTRCDACLQRVRKDGARRRNRRAADHKRAQKAGSP